MRNPKGYAVVTNPRASLVRLDDKTARPEMSAEGTLEYDTYTCGHCGRVRHVRPREDPTTTGGLCKQCMSLICPHCLQTGRCDPLEAKLERAEKRDMMLRSCGL